MLLVNYDIISAVSVAGFVCFKCGQALALAPTGVSFRERCEGCSQEVHACMNCEFYDTGSHHECRENQAEYVKDKERSNRCEYFRLGRKVRAAATNKDQFAKLDDLFK